ncbi:MAG: FAD-dependent oxidoreductase [Deltaproteobacteria bacterium]|nr:FAD-dependent oxidoreductase [Deltaproteobacteria bacterium]
MESTRSIWRAEALPSAKGPLDADTRADVCVIGGGITGLSVAYQLAKNQRSVVVLEMGLLGEGQTQYTTAQLSSSIDCRYFQLEQWHGETGSHLAAESHTAAIDATEAIIRDEGIDCDFERLDGYLFLGPDDSAETLTEELTAARRAGLDVTHTSLSWTPGSVPALRFPKQAQFHPLKYLTGLYRATEARGGRVYTMTRAQGIVTGKHPIVTTQSGLKIHCEAVVVATKSPMNDRFAIHTKQAPYTTYVVGLRATRPIARHLYWDTGSAHRSHPRPYHYVRLAKDPNGVDFLLVGGEDHKTGQANDGAERFYHLERWGRDLFPGLEETAYQWSGEIHEPVDGLGFIGPNPAEGEKNIFLVTGDAGMGMTYAGIAGFILRDLIERRPNPWAHLYDPARKTLRAVGTFTRENLNVASQYATWVTPGELHSTDSIAPGEGAVIRQGLHKIAAYRDPTGHVHEFSAVCPHLGCLVAWNSTEKTWDCPCHGSRFNARGAVVLGPATQNLAPIPQKKTA